MNVFVREIAPLQAIVFIFLKVAYALCVKEANIWFAYKSQHHTSLAVLPAILVI